MKANSVLQSFFFSFSLLTLCFFSDSLSPFFFSYSGLISGRRGISKKEDRGKNEKEGREKQKIASKQLGLRGGMIEMHNILKRLTKKKVGVR